MNQEKEGIIKENCRHTAEKNEEVEIGAKKDYVY